MHSVLTKERLFAMTTSLTIRMDDALKAEAEEFFDDIGMNMTTAITCFFKKCLATGKIPFTLSRETKRERLLAALREAEEVANDPNAPTCTDPDKLEEFMLS
jgi:DNA-damage-inducible protein J